jgi:hypothetical protein
MTVIGLLGFIWLGVGLARRGLRLSGLRGKQVSKTTRDGRSSLQPLVTSETYAQKANQGSSLSFVNMEISIITIDQRG